MSASTVRRFEDESGHVEEGTVHAIVAALNRIVEKRTAERAAPAAGDVADQIERHARELLALAFKLRRNGSGGLEAEAGEAAEAPAAVEGSTVYIKPGGDVVDKLGRKPKRRSSPGQRSASEQSSPSH